MRSNIRTLIFSKPKFDRSSAVAWASAHDFADRKVIEDAKTIRIRQHAGEEGAKYTTIKIAAGVRGEVESSELIGKYSQVGAATGGGAAPALDNTSLPDFETIYNHPRSQESEEHEMQVRQTRRASLARANSGRYGIYGQTTTEPVVKYDTRDYPAIVRSPKLRGTSPKLVVRGTNPEILKPKDKT